MRRIVPALCLSIALISCGGDAEPEARSTGPPSVMLLGRNLELLGGPERAVRVAFQPFGSAARLIVRFTPTDAVLDACPLASFRAPVPDRSACMRDLRTGVRQTVTARDLRALAVVSHDEERVSMEIVLEFEEAGRDVTIGLPLVSAPPGGVDCGDNACNPFFEIQPSRSGPFTASMTWAGPDAELVLLQGSVLGRSQTATGIPYAEPARAQGSSPLAIDARLSAPAEYALALRHRRAGATIPPMTGVVIEASWP